MRVLSWNLYHGRAKPPAGRPLLGEFSEALAGWDWDVALLQEVPPWWPPALARAAGATERTTLTSRNQLLALRRLVAERRPDLIKSGGGGANAILVRGATITDHRWRTLRRLPERRVVHGVGLDGELWVANVHAQAHSERWAQADIALAARTAVEWASGAPVVLGGDFNQFRPQPEGFDSAGGRGVDHVFVHRLRPIGKLQPLPHEPLSDHAPVVVEVQPVPS